MLWNVMAATLVAGIVALILVMLSKRGVHVDQLGSVSNRWIAEHRVD